MLTIVVKGKELWDEKEQVFVKPDEDVVLEFEHSLVSLSKWESKFQKPFLTSTAKTTEEAVAYIRCMLVTTGVDDKVLNRLSVEDVKSINNYMNSTESATTFGELPKHTGPRETVTSELIYFWMTNYNIPLEWENRHLNRLFSLIRVANVKNSKPKKIGRHEQAQRQRAENARRKKEMNTSG